MPESAASIRILASPLLYSFLTFSVTLTSACHSAPPSTVPDLTLTDVRGGRFNLRSQPPRPLLLTFLQTVPDSSDTPSRSQVVFVASMAQQYAPHGLRVAAVDATVLALGSPPSLDDVRNASYDWQLSLPLLIDEDGSVARGLGVDRVPATFLISAQGRIVRQWRGVARPAMLAESIEELLDGPLANKR